MYHPCQVSAADELLTMSEDQRAAKRRRSVPTANIQIHYTKLTHCRYTSPIITIEVGSDLVALTVHDDRLRHSSDYFKAALSKNWVEGQRREVILPPKLGDRSAI